MLEELQCQMFPLCFVIFPASAIGGELVVSVLNNLLCF